MAEEEEFSFAAKHDVKFDDRDWEDPLFFAPDGTFHREHGIVKSGDGGTWDITSGEAWPQEITLTWEDHDPEVLVTKDGGRRFFNKDGFTLDMEEGEPPEWFTSKFRLPQAWEDMLGNKYTTADDKTVEILRQRHKKGTITFTFDDRMKRGTIDGQTLQVPRWSPGIIQENGDVEFEDGGVWKFEEKQEIDDPDEPAEYEEFEFDGEHDFKKGNHGKWKGGLMFGNDHTFHRPDRLFGKGDRGTWESKNRKELVLKWEDKDEEVLITKDHGKSFQNKLGFKLVMEEVGEEPPEWFTKEFHHLEAPGFLTCCCPNTHRAILEREEAGADHSGQIEPHSIFEQALEAVVSVAAAAEDKIEDVLEDVSDLVENVQDAIGDVVDGVRDAAVDALGLDEKFKSVADNSLDDIAPKAGDMVVADAVEYIPGFETLDNATSRDIDGEAKQVCADKILSFREKIHDFCEDVVEFLKDCADVVQGALKCIYKVVSWILRACKEGVQVAIDLVKKVIPDCCEAACLSCCGLGAKLIEFVTNTFNKIVDMVEEFIQAALRAVGVPEWICEKIDFNGNSSADNATDDDEPEKVKRTRTAEAAMAAAEEAPQQQSMEGEEGEPTV